MLSISFLAAIVITAASCQSKKADNEYVPAPAVNVVPKPATAPANGTALPINPSVLPAIPVQPGTGARPAVNPAHGQPFHDCAIAVGAPLPQAVQPAAQTLPAAQPVLPQNTPGVKLNPAHGQPGHRCELPVGAPLS